MTTRLVQLLVVALSFGMPLLAKASCTGTAPQISTLSTPSTIVVDQGVAIGSKLTDFTTTLHIPPYSFQCTSPFGLHYASMEFPSAQGFPGVYKTGVPGIGMVLTTPGGSAHPLEMHLPDENSTTTSSFGSGSQTYVVELYRTGDIEPGVISGLITRLTLPVHNFLLREVSLAPTKVEVLRPTCTIADDSVNIPVKLGTHSTDENYQNLPWIDFSIRLNCGGGTSGGALGVHITLTDAQRPDSVSSSFRFTGSDAATGLVVNIARADGTLIYAGPESSAIGNTNQWQAGTVATGESTFTIPLKARIVPDGSVMRPGAANTSALFTLAYD